MKSFILKNRKKLMIFSPFFAVLILCFYLYNFLGETVGLILTVTLKPKFLIGKIEMPKNFSKAGKIVAKEVVLTYKEQEIVRAPEIEILYNLSSPLNKWIEKIIIDSPEVLIERDKSNVNIVEAFSTGGKSKTVKEVPLGEIIVKNANLLYRDISYEFPIEKKLNLVEGYVRFDAVKGIDLKFQGYDKDSSLSYSFNNEIEDYSMNISGKNISLDTKILQYAYYYKELEYEDGIGDLDLTISPKGLLGYADIKNLTVNYKPFLEKAKNIKGKVEFNGEKIDIQADFELFEKNRYFSLNFDFNNELDIEIDLGDLSYEEVSNYYLLKNLNLNTKNLNFKDSKINLNLSKEKKFTAKVNLAIENIDEEKYSYKDGKIDILASDDGIRISLSESQIKILDLTKTVSIDLTLKDELMKINYFIDNFKGEGNLYFDSEKILLESQNGFFKTKGSFDYKDKILQLEDLEEILEEDKFSVEYDFQNNKLIHYKGKIKINLLDEYFSSVEGMGKENLLTIETFLINDKAENLIFISEGEVDLNNLFYSFRFKMEDFNFDKIFDSNKIKTTSSFTGEIRNQKEGLILDLDGTLEKLDINGFIMRGIKTSVRLKENLIEILDVSNNFLTFKGDYNIIENSLKGKFEINEFTNDSFGIETIAFNLFKSKGEIQGPLNNLEIKADILKSEVYFPNGESVIFSGEAVLRDKKIYFNDFILNSENIVNGKYSLENSEYEISGKISEKNIFKYLKLNKLKANLQGDFFLTGNKESLRINSKLDLDRIYFKGKDIPDIKIDLKYDGAPDFQGILTFNSISFLREEYKIGELFGKLNLKDKSLDIQLRENSFRVGKAFPDYKIKGPVELNFKLYGEIKSPNYEFSLKSEGLNYEEIQFENLVLKGYGDLNDVNLEMLNFKYQKNNFLASGNYSISSKKYEFKLNSQDIQLDFLNAFLEKYNTSIKGRAYFDLILNDKGNTGVFAGENIGFNFEKQGIKSEKIDFEFELSKKKLEVVDFQGFINEGKTKVAGFLEIPTLEEIENNPYFFEKLNYDLTFNLEKFIYKVPSYMDFTISSNLNLNSNKIKGELEIEKGNVIKIPGVGEGFNILKIVKDFIFEKAINKKLKKDEIWSEDEIGALESKIDLDVDIRISEGIKLDVDSISGIVQNLVGNFKGGGKFSGTGRKVNFLGEFQLNNGEFVLTDNEFQINSARVIFNNPKDIFPEVNPLITFEASSKSFTDNISLSLNGELNALQFAIKSNGNVSTGNLSSLFSNSSEENSNKNAVSSLLLKSAIDSQITQTFLGPFSREMKKFFGLSKLRISSDFTSSIVGENSSQDESVGRKDQEYSFGAKVEVADSLYKEKLYWVASAKITNNTSTEEESTGGSFNEYSAGLLYRFSQSNSLEIGVQSFGKDTVGIKNKETDQKSLNYYIDFKIQKKYDSLSEIFKNLINKVKK